jgi:hypothetical protein
MGALLAMIPGKDLAYIVAIVAIVAGGWYWHHETIVKTQERDHAAYVAAGAKAQADAQAKIAEFEKQHAADVAKVQETYEKQHQADIAQRSSDLERLRQFDAYRRAHQVSGNPAGKPAAASSGGSSTSDFIQILSGLEPVASGLADSTRQSTAALSACMAERNSLTGK